MLGALEPIQGHAAVFPLTEPADYRKAASDDFSLFDPRLDPIFTLAADERLPVLVHAGAGVEPFGPRLLSLFDRFPGLRLVLAHAGLTDLAWLAERAEEFPTLFFDTSWWSTADLLTLFAQVPPGQILLAGA